MGSRLIFRTGPTAEVLGDLVKTFKATRICWNRRYESGLVDIDRELKAVLQNSGLEVQTFNAGLLFEPWEIRRAAKEQPHAPYKVFTAYWRACSRAGVPGVMHERPKKLPACSKEILGERLEDLGLLPRIRWDAGLHLSLCRRTVQIIRHR